MFNCGDEYSIYRALEDAGAGIEWDIICKDHRSKTDCSSKDDETFKRFLKEEFTICNVKKFLEEFANEHNLTINYIYPCDDKEWGEDILKDRSKEGKRRQQRKITIRQEQKGGYEFTAVFSTKVVCLIFGLFHIL